MTIQIQPSGEAEASLWRTTLEVSRLFAGWPWVLIGAQAIALTARALGRDVGRATRDVDVVVDLRVVTGGAREAAGRLVDAGFEPSAEHAHRFERATDQVDLLAPDHLGPRADLTTVAPRKTIEIPGATRALGTRRDIAIEVAAVGEGVVWVPSLAGLIVLKVSAWQGRRAERDLEDLVRLLDLIPDPGRLIRELKPAERRRLAAIDVLDDPGLRAWTVAQDPAEARAALARITAGDRAQRR